MWLNIYLASPLPSSSRWFTSPWGTVSYPARNQLKPPIPDSSFKSRKVYHGDKIRWNPPVAMARNLTMLLLFFTIIPPFWKKNWGGHMSFCEATDTPILDFWWRLLWVSEPEPLLFLYLGPFWSQLITLVFYLSDLTLGCQSQCTFGSYLVCTCQTCHGCLCSYEASVVYF